MREFGERAVERLELSFCNLTLHDMHIAFKVINVS